MKKNQPILFLALLIIISIVFAACNSGESAEEEAPITPTDPIEAITADSTMPELDTTTTTRGIEREPEALPASKSGPGEANVAYSFFRKIKNLETKDIRVLIKTRATSQQVVRHLREIEQREESELEIEKDTNTIRTLSITGYETLLVSLVFDSADFEMTPVDTQEKQKLDTNNGNYWHWRAKAKTDKKSSNIIIIVKAENAETGLEEKDVKEIPISIEIDHKNAFRATWNWIIHNPQYSVPTIFVPLVLFVVGYIRKRAKGIT